MPTSKSATPYSLLSIAGALEAAGYSVTFIDFCLENISPLSASKMLQKISPRCIILSSTLGTLKEDTRMLRGLSKKTHKACVVFPPYDPKKILKREPLLDSIILGYDYENVSIELVKTLIDNNDVSKLKGIAYKIGEEIIQNQLLPPTDISDLPLPTYNLAKMELYPNFVVTQTSRGCPYGCIFCPVAGKKWVSRTPTQVVDEMELMEKKYKKRVIRFIDPEFTMRYERTQEICEEYLQRRLKIKWTCDSRVDLVDKSLLKAMKKANCIKILYGAESGSNEILREIKKRTNTEEIFNAIKWTKEVGILDNTTFMFGSPSDNYETFNATMKFIKKLKPTISSGGFLKPYPNTEVYKIGLRKGLIENTDVFTYNITDYPPMKTQYLTSDEVYQLSLILAKECNSLNYSFKYLMYRLREEGLKSLPKLLLKGLKVVKT